jgi:hypothetical protein
LVAACAVLLALNQWLSPMAVAGIAFLAISIFCHVAGNAIGTRLRAIGDQRQTPEEDSALGTGRLEARDFAPVTRLSQRRSLGWTIAVAGLTGLIVGGFGGGFVTLHFSTGPVDPANVLIGIIAFGTLGGMGSFLIAGFLQVIGGAIWQALSSASNPSLRRSPNSAAQRPTSDSQPLAPSP